MRKIRLLNNIDYLENKLERDYSIIKENNGIQRVITFKHNEKEIVVEFIDIRDSVDKEVKDCTMKITKLIRLLLNSEIKEDCTEDEVEFLDVIKDYLENNVLSVVFGEIDVILGEVIYPSEEKVEYVTNNVRFRLSFSL